ncbi:multidrug effflux MFS transporter [Azomonas macrocytogenes]|uniref:Bcr/CflA family efflux transporter n=1 Tax=Azomonas macrocytogenes TaxID=69962 RepID=A0A839T1C6_AZOMA|nr:multidrug effflux MFS transporter [Azomonas macrocytogenes]MBB3102390.1 DHA1 family bicyclomycin/chloramphenicol resistance-like MFS transporter [Azomonas macrocytogenes]
MTLRILLILGALTAFGPMAIDLYLPSFPTLAVVFSTDIEHVQLSLAAYFIGLALGQLIYGPVIDRYGRRLPLLFGTVIFSLASLACAFSPSLDWLIAMRFVQAFGGCVGMVASRTVVRDLCDPPTTAKVFSQLMLVMGIAPILAPLIGGLLLQWFGWASIFVVLMVFGGLCGLAVLLWLPETYPAGLPPAPMSGALRQYWRLLSDRAFMGHVLTGGFAMSGMFAYIAGSPHVFIELYAIPAQHYGWLFGSNAAGFIFMSQVNARLLRLRGPYFWLPRWICVYFVSGLALLAIALSRPAMLWPLLLPLFCCIASLGCIIPNATACAMAKQADNAGSASALMGSLQFASAAIAAASVGAFGSASAIPLAGVICSCGLLAILASASAKASLQPDS